MRKQTRIWLIIAASFILIGSIIFVGAMTMFNWDFTKLSTVNYQTNNYEILEEYTNISITADTAHIVFVPSENAESSVVCYEQENAKHSVTVKDGTLVIAVADTRKWHEYLGINFFSPKITVNIPQGQYGTLSVKSETGNVEIPKDFIFESIDISETTGAVTNYASASQFINIKTSTGAIRVENVTASNLALSVSTGKVTVSGVSCEEDVCIDVSTGKTDITDTNCKNLISNGDTGSISLKNVVATDKFSIKRSTGDVKFDDCDAASLFIKTDTGDVTGSLLTEKVFIAQTDTGSVRVPKTATGGKCEIITDTGDIKIEIN